jgi:polyhydroxyalkanoate synthase
VVNHPAKKKYQYWTSSEKLGRDLDKWMASAKEHAGSWWPDWIDWIKSHDKKTVAARKPGGGKYKSIEDAPGSYVKVKS